MPERRNLWNKRQKKSCWKSWKKWQNSRLIHMVICKVMRCCAALWWIYITLLHRIRKAAPTKGINWRRAENKNNSASGYGVLLSKNQHRESTILEGYFKQLGMSGEELQTAVQDFKTKRATQAKEKETSYQNAQQEIVRLKAQVLYCIVS